MGYQLGYLELKVSLDNKSWYANVPVEKAIENCVYGTVM